jgi:hypothetical protein
LPTGDLEARVGVGHAWQVGQHVGLVQRGGRERAHRPGPDVRQERRRRAEVAVDRAVDQRVHRRLRTRERHVLELDAGSALEQLAGEMRDRAAADRGVAQAPALPGDGALRRAGERRHVVPARLGVDGEDHLRLGEQRDRNERPRRVHRRVGERCREHARVGHDRQRRAGQMRPRGVRVGRWSSPRSALRRRRHVLDQHRRAEPLPEVFAERPRQHVGRSPRGEGDDDRRVGLVQRMLGEIGLDAVLELGAEVLEHEVDEALACPFRLRLGQVEGEQRAVLHRLLHVAQRDVGRRPLQRDTAGRPARRGEQAVLDQRRDDLAHPCRVLVHLLGDPLGGDDLGRVGRHVREDVGRRQQARGLGHARESMSGVYAAAKCRCTLSLTCCR